MARRHLSKSSAKDLAGERVDRLFELASSEAHHGNDARAKRYVELALRMGERHKVPSRHKRTFCPKCHTFFVPPRNVRVRTNRGKISFTCLSCGAVIRFPLGKK